MENKEEDNNLNDPEFQYNKVGSDKVVHIFSSLEEMEEENYKWLATLTPEQHLQNAIVLIKRIFEEDLKNNPKIGKNLSFD